MSTQIIVPSFLHPDKIAYKLVSDAYNYYSHRGEHPLHTSILQFETYGDGTCQHSSEWCPQFNALADVCISFAAGIVADPAIEAWYPLQDLNNLVASDILPFALSIKYVEGKPKYFSVGERKVTSADKRNDRRYERVERCHDGSPTGAFAALGLVRSRDWLEKMLIMDKLRGLAAASGQGWYDWDDLMPATKELAGDWRNALSALNSAVEALCALRLAGGNLRCAQHNSQPRPEAVAA